MKKPKQWYGFQWSCELHDYRDTNMSPESQRHTCKRKDRQGNDRPYWKAHYYFELLSCHWNVCPKLKELRKKAGNDQISCPPFSMYGHKNADSGNTFTKSDFS